MLNFFYKDINQLLRGGLVVAAILFGGEWLKNASLIYLNVDFSLLYNVLFYSFLAIWVFVLLRSCAKVFFLLSTKKENNVLSVGINRNAKYPCRDEKDALLVRISSLYSITSVGNGESKKYPNFINCIEECNLSEPDAVEGIKLALSASYDINTSGGLTRFIADLLDEENYSKQRNDDYKKPLSHLYQLAEKTGANLKPVSEINNLTAAFNLQRAALLMRSGVTCGFLSIEEWDSLKDDVVRLMEQEFPSIDQFIHDYMLAVYLFHMDGSFSAFMILERLYGLAIFQEHDYLSWNAAMLNNPSL
ncbi:DUF1266 domain-containing protein [Pectobacterium parmentieri]|uniref:DUF1266 domain-containing protein n=1 Tax=Pectobacterium parmentieri TaxID=1905730 RepID=UPI000CDCFE00|nr:DUF1266 domain-containing protein [Pectobacterium parmentieri]AYH05020.1 DUF1266 domain-containing protein [Pectobacterium parmentieri]AYH13841.1 DUF1266 domain-containing protein [Pectobacterium parmentieri]AYH22544.1 DUF1266 domain-containing protein [Pectobacterium parmentieri]MBI0519384.1 DUF1266 domain-containing protein [Pectobacterium parmentieri]POW25595.1 hypothetical protein PB20LOC_03337 [Pectobacterium parmentieri]